tara:strand:+ start:576 stop:698 length:123 start_codon:yes stop_codon:yes gene_type:complete
MKTTNIILLFFFAFIFTTKAVGEINFDFADTRIAVPFQVV